METMGLRYCTISEEITSYKHITDSLPTKLLVREYLTALPDENVLAAELRKTRTKLEKRR